MYLTSEIDVLFPMAIYRQESIITSRCNVALKWRISDKDPLCDGRVVRTTRPDSCLNKLSNAYSGNTTCLLSALASPMTSRRSLAKLGRRILET